MFPLTHRETRILALRSAPIRVSGACMEPLLLDGDEVWLSAEKRILPGDLVLTKDSMGTNTVHRLLGVRPSRHGLLVLTQADNAQAADPALPLDRLLGRVTVSVSLSDRLFALRRYGVAMVKTSVRLLRQR